MLLAECLRALLILLSRVKGKVGEIWKMIYCSYISWGRSVIGAYVEW
jgi:hypothetical protein